jgi:hypothetical protein
MKFLILPILCIALAGLYVINDPPENFTDLKAEVVSYSPLRHQMVHTGNWTGRKEFPESMAVRLEDGSVWDVDYILRVDQCKAGATAVATARIGRITGKIIKVPIATCGAEFK